GYALLGIFPTKTVVLISLSLIAIGGSFVKPVISGTVKKTSPPDLSKLGFSIFYMVVNIGGFTGKIVAKLLRQDLGGWISHSRHEAIKGWVAANVPPFEIDAALAARAAEQSPPMSPESFLEMLKWQGFGMQAICLFSAAMALVALVLAAVLYREPDRTGEPAISIGKTFADMVRLFGDLKFVSFILIFAGFDLMFWQLYLTIPKYIVTHISETAPMEWIVSINPLMIILLQLPVARLVMRVRPLHTMALGMGISAAAMVLMGVFPTLWGAGLSIMLFAIGEMTFAPRFLEYISSLAPRGKVGLYLGFSYLRSFIAYIVGGWLGGKLLVRYVPETGEREPLGMFLVFAAIGAAALVALFAYDRVVGEQSGEERAAA
ncbi:MAG: hypothetical protein PHQ19_10175, partial [Candidatus Krumholzibacteria bacterium]|nr:hypothetical protein [Candidatus Krumholzibacteria bacterium]